MKDDLTELLDSIDMESYLSLEGIDFKLTRGRSGDQLQVKECPVCGSDSWKVYLNAETGAGNCFAGSHPPNQNYSKWSFIRAHMGDAKPAEVFRHIKQAAMELGWRPKRLARATELPPELKLPDHIELPHEGKNLRYLVDRGIKAETAKVFGLRYCEAGFFRYTMHGEHKFQPWGGRLIIPVFDLDGGMVTFQGRDVTGTSDRKYLFPPGLPSTGRYLLNGHNAIGAKTVVVGEGAFDVMAMKQAFDEDQDTRHLAPIGSFGKHLSIGGKGDDDQLAAFLRLRDAGLKEVVFMWDAEPAALNAAVAAGMALNGYGLKCRLARLPEGKDPNEVPAAAVRAAFWAALPITAALAMKLRLGVRE